ncbi:MAG: phosphoribosylanthranilate isomerase [Rhizobiales bacterium]|nr:phosphoribosylanthranilate isomerase [Hyphomicrobiales bacterium]
MLLQVKICGIKDEDMLGAAIDAGADFVGFVFFPKSPRHVSVSQASELARFLRQTPDNERPKIVSLVVNATDEELELIYKEVQPDYIQLHGSETAERTNEINERFQTPLIKAIGVTTASDVALADDYSAAEIILFDAKADPKLTDLPGGNGIPFDWTALTGQKEKRNFMLSGGLTPENVAEAIALTRASIVDVSSGVETSPGVKDRALIQDFIKAAKGAT